MNRVYAVKINGRTLESRNIKELLARAVNAKRNPDRRIRLNAEYFKRLSSTDASASYPQSGIAALIN